MSETANSNGRSSRRKPLKTTRILAEMDDETSGTEYYYASDGLVGLRDKLLSDYVSGNTERRLRSGRQPLTGVGDDNKMVDGDIPSDTVVISSSPSSEDVSTRTPKQPSQPPTTHLKIDSDTSSLLPIDEYNVGSVLEKLLAMMQSMSMLLSALKNDLRHCSMPEVVAKKRDAATTQLWRAFMTYQKSFSEIEQFARVSKSSGQTAKKSRDEPVHLPSQSRVNQAGPVRAARRSRSLQVQEADVIELSESDSDDESECKRPRYDESAETMKQSAQMAESSAAVEPSISPALIVSSSDSSLAPSALKSNAAFDASSDTSASCVCVDVEPPSESPLHADDASCDLPESLDSEPVSGIE